MGPWNTPAKSRPARAGRARIETGYAGLEMHAFLVARPVLAGRGLKRRGRGPVALRHCRPARLGRARIETPTHSPLCAPARVARPARIETRMRRRIRGPTVVARPRWAEPGYRWGGERFARAAMASRLTRAA